MQKIVNAFAIIAILTILGCTYSELWQKPSAMEGERERDISTCQQESQEREGSSHMNAYSGSSVMNAYSGSPVNKLQFSFNLFFSCMEAKGWRLESNEIAQQNQASADELKRDIKEQFNQVDAQKLAICAMDALQEYYKKSACQGLDISFEQLADTTTITAEQKSALVKYTEEQAVLGKAYDKIHAQRGAIGLKIISLGMSYAQPEREKNHLDLYNEKITWGDYNKRRKEIAIETQKKIKELYDRQ